MIIVEVTNLKFTENAAENISLAPLDKSERYDVVLARVRPKETLRLHKHVRPDNGDEIFLFHKGGTFDVRSDGMNQTVQTENPVLIRFPSGEPHSIINRADSFLEFFAFYIPPFEVGEVQRLDHQ